MTLEWSLKLTDAARIDRTEGEALDQLADRLRNYKPATYETTLPADSGIAQWMRGLWAASQEERRQRAKVRKKARRAARKALKVRRKRGRR